MNQTHNYNVAVFDISMGHDRAELVETVWRGDEFEQGEERFEEECERIKRMVLNRQLEPKSTLVLLRQHDGYQEERKVI